MTPAEYLPFERGIKDGLLVYLRRLGKFFMVMAAAFFLCGMIGEFFIPHPEKQKTPGGNGLHLGFITLIVVGATAGAIAIHHTLSVTFQLRTSRYSVYIESTLLVFLLVAVTVSLFMDDALFAAPMVLSLVFVMFDRMFLLKSIGKTKRRSLRKR